MFQTESLKFKLVRNLNRIFRFFPFSKVCVLFLKKFLTTNWFARNQSLDSITWPNLIKLKLQKMLFFDFFWICHCRSTPSVCSPLGSKVQKSNLYEPTAFCYYFYSSLYFSLRQALTPSVNRVCETLLSAVNLKLSDGKHDRQINFDC